MQSDKMKSLMPRKCSTENTWHHLNEMQRMTGLTKYALVLRAVELMWKECFSKMASADEKDALFRASLRAHLDMKLALLEGLRKPADHIAVGSPDAKQDAIDPK